jgi:hypothetical protein
MHLVSPIYALIPQIPVSSINIGPINKKDVMRANAMIERGHKKYGVILAFDVPGQCHLVIWGGVCLPVGVL